MKLKGLRLWLGIRDEAQSWQVMLSVAEIIVFTYSKSGLTMWILELCIYVGASVAKRTPMSLTDVRRLVQ